MRDILSIIIDQVECSPIKFLETKGEWETSPRDDSVLMLKLQLVRTIRHNEFKIPRVNTVHSK